MKLFKRESAREDNSPSVIGNPTNVQHDIHVIKNAAGHLEGLPEAWIRQIGNQITKAEQSNNPDAVLQAVKYYNYSMKKKEPEPFKVFITEEEVIEETKAIDNFMNSRDAHQSKDSIKDIENKGRNDRYKFNDDISY